MLQPMADTERPDTSELTAFIHEQMPLCALLGVEALEMDPGGVRLAAVAGRPVHGGGMLHGGALIALADSAGAACAFGNPRGSHWHVHHRVEDQLPRCGRQRHGQAAARRVDHHRGRDRGAGRRRSPVAKITQTQIVLRRGS